MTERRRDDKGRVPTFVRQRRQPPKETVRRLPDGREVTDVELHVEFPPGGEQFLPLLAYSKARHLGELARMLRDRMRQHNTLVACGDPSDYQAKLVVDTFIELRDAMRKVGIQELPVAGVYYQGSSKRDEVELALASLVHTMRAIRSELPASFSDDSLGEFPYLLAVYKSLPALEQTVELFERLARRGGEPPNGNELDSELSGSKGAGQGTKGRCASLSICPGGFEYHGRRYDLTGKPLAMLRAVLETRDHVCAVADLLDEVWHDSSATHGTVRSTARTIRRKLRQAIGDAREHVDDPLKAVDKGASLAYRLILP